MQVLWDWYATGLMILLPWLLAAAPVILVLLFPAVLASVVPVIANLTGRWFPWNFVIEAIRWTIIVVALCVAYWAFTSYMSV